MARARLPLSGAALLTVLAGEGAAGMCLAWGDGSVGGGGEMMGCAGDV